MINITYKLQRVHTIPVKDAFTDVIGKVEWEILFSDGVSTSSAMIETLLDTSDLIEADFRAFSVMNKTEILALAKAQVGLDELLASITKPHEEQVTRLSLSAGMESKDVAAIID